MRTMEWGASAGPPRCRPGYDSLMLCTPFERLVHPTISCKKAPEKEPEKWSQHETCFDRKTRGRKYILLVFSLSAARRLRCILIIVSIVSRIIHHRTPSGSKRKIQSVPEIHSFVAARICQSQQRKQKLTCLGWPMRLPWISRRGGCRSPGRTGCRRHRGRPTDGKTGGCPGTARPCACCGGVRPCLFRGLGKINNESNRSGIPAKIWRKRSVCPSPSLDFLFHSFSRHRQINVMKNEQR